MTLISGTRLGPYEILSPLGAGGMGEVYRARDAKLNRDVAIKVLPESVAQDAERLARFQREAQVLAALNHAHIAAIYGIEKSGDLEALVLELVEGDTLAERIAAGPIPVDEALAIARQIAEALEAAHDKGIIHRDLKPANVKITPDGRVKVLDFGLAKALHRDGSSSPDVTRSPTLTAASTQAGVVIGTAAYMSPEQARGKGVDKRADIWAFGAVLYEMLTGRKTFEGETVSDMLAAVLRADIDWAALPRETPPSVRRVLRRCLDRDPKTRFHDIADARLELDEKLEVAPAAPLAARPPRRAPWLVALAALALVAGFGWWRALNFRPAAAPSAVRFAVSLPPTDQIPFDDMPVLDLSRDGKSLVFLADHDGKRQLYLRTRNRIDPMPIAGTEGASSPFFSPDGHWVGFFAEGKLKKVAVEGGAAMTLADAPNNRGGVWLEDDSIVYAPDYTVGLTRLAARGGKPETLTTPDAKGGERTHRWPTHVPGDSAVLFTVGMLTGPGNYDDARIALWDPVTRKTRVLLEGASMARYAPSGHLVFLRAETLFAVSFDARLRRVTGEPVALSDRVSNDPSSGVAYVALAADGSAAFVPATGPVTGRSIVLTDRSGKARALPVPSRSYNYPRFSPDGKRLVVSIGPGHGNSDDVWTVDIETGALARVTFGNGNGNGNYYPIWSNDGQRVAYSSDRSHQGIYLKNADGTGEEEALQPTARPQLPADWSRDGSMLAITQNFPSTDILTVSWPGRKESPVESFASCPVFSPDGRWIAYTVLAPGNPPQILVKPVSGAGGKVQITSDRGAYPIWTDDGLVFMNNKKILAIDVQTQPAFKAGPIRELFDAGPYDRGSLPLRNFDVTRDGKSFVFVTGVSGRDWKQVDVALDWSSGLPKIAPASKR
ncbi:MAG TPA: protein kinase [Thermoanaerobaculia bacterium]